MDKAVRVWFPEQGRVELQEFEPKDPSEGEVTLRAECTLISPGTELAFLHGLPNTSGAFPMGLGYSFAGRILRIGRGVEGFAEGDRVAATARHSSVATVAASRVTKIPDALASEEAAYFQMATYALGAVRKAQVEIGETVIVLGLGIIGNLALQCARIGGGCPVVGTDVFDRRREAATACGADLVCHPGVEEVRARLRAAAGRQDADVVIDATGLPEAIHDCLGLAAYRARVILLGSARGETEKVNFYRDVHKKGLSIIGAHGDVRPRAESTKGYWTLADDWSTGLRLMAGGRLVVRPLTTDVLPYLQAPRAYQMLLGEKDRHIGVILDWR